MRSKLLESQLLNAELQTRLDGSQGREREREKQQSLAVIQHTLLKQDQGAAISLLTNGMESKPPTAAVQLFATKVIAKCSVDGKVKLKTKGRPIIYERVKGIRLSKAAAKPRSRARWLKNQANRMLSLCGSEDEEAIIALLRAMGKKKGLFMAERAKLSLSTAQSVVLRDHVKSSNNGLLRIKQCIECFAPDLKGILLQPNILKHVSNMKKHGVVPSQVIEVCCTTTKKGNKKGMCTFYYCSRPTQLLGNMFRRMFLDNTVEKSIDFSSLEDMLLVAVGFDKSDSDFVGTWRPCNRRNGNSAIFVQTFACLEGPVCECYENEEITIANGDYPIQDTIQQLVDDRLYCLVSATSSLHILSSGREQIAN